MPDRADILELVQVGKETTFGTAVTGSKKLLAMTLDLDPKIPTEEVRGRGYKAPVGTVVGKEQTDLNFSGPAAYNDLLYVFATSLEQPAVSTPNKLGVFTFTITGTPTGGTFTITYDGQTTAGIAYNAAASAVESALVALSNIGASDVDVTGSAGGPYTVTFQGDLANTSVTPTASGAGLTGGTTPSVTVAAVAAGTASLWTFQPSDTDADTFDSLTVEKGSSAGASRVAGVRFDEWELVVTPEKSVEFKGKAIGKDIVDGITMTGSPTEVALKVVSPRDVSFYLASSIGGLSAGQIFPLEGKIGLKNRHTPVYRVDASDTSFAKTVERMLELQAQITVEQDTTADAYMALVRESTTRYLRIVATGENIETGVPYTLQITLPVKFTNPKRNPKADLHCGVYDLQGIYDATAGYTVNVQIKSDLAAL